MTSTQTTGASPIRQAQQQRAADDRDRQEQQEQAPTDPLLAAVQEDPPTALRLKPGETWVGEYVRLDRGETRGYGPAWIAVLADETTGELRGLWLLHEALTNQLKKARPTPGDRVAVRYIGPRESAEGRTYHDWRAVSGRQLDARAALSWADVEGGDDIPEDVAPHGAA